MPTKHEIEASQFALEVKAIYEKGPDSFIDGIQHCKNKIDDLLSKHSQTAVCKKLVPVYRRAIHREIFGTIAYDYKSLPVPTNWFSLPLEITLAENEKTQKNAEMKRVNRIPLNDDIAQNIIDDCVSILTTDNVLNGAQIGLKTVAIQVLTGRRCFVELLRNAIFERSDKDDTLIFDGQAKKHGDFGPYEIPILYPEPDLIIDNHEKIIATLQAKRWYSPDIDPDRIESNYGKVVKDAIKAVILPHFIPYFERENEPLPDLASHDMRRLYACICHHFYAPRSAYEVYAFKILGHKRDEEAKAYNRFVFL